MIDAAFIINMLHTNNIWSSDLHGFGAIIKIISEKYTMDIKVIFYSYCILLLISF